MSLLLVLLTRAVFVLVAVAVVCVDAATVGGGVVAVDDVVCDSAIDMFAAMR